MSNNFAYFKKPINECSDSELVDFYICFLNGSDSEDEGNQKIYEEFKAEVPKRSETFQSKIAYIDSIL